MKFNSEPTSCAICFPCNDKEKILDQFSNYET